MSYTTYTDPSCLLISSQTEHRRQRGVGVVSVIGQVRSGHGVNDKAFLSAVERVQVAYEVERKSNDRIAKGLLAYKCCKPQQTKNTVVQLCLALLNLVVQPFLTPPSSP